MHSMKLERCKSFLTSHDPIQLKRYKSFLTSHDPIQLIGLTTIYTYDLYAIHLKYVSISLGNITHNTCTLIAMRYIG